MDNKYQVSAFEIGEDGVSGGMVITPLGVNPGDIKEHAENAAQIHGIKNPYEKETNEHTYWDRCYAEAREEIYSEFYFYVNDDCTVRNIGYYICLAKDAIETESSRKLSEALGLAHNAVSRWESSDIMPTEDAIKKLAKLAGIPQEQALLELSYWNADDESKVTYEKIIKRVVNAASIFFAFLGLLVVSTPVYAASLILPTTTSIFTTVLPGIYIIKLFWLLFTNLVNNKRHSAT